MELNDVPEGEEIAVDANVLVYHFSGTSSHCSHFVSRIAAGDVQGWIGAQTAAELSHRLMILEAQSQGLLVGNNPARRLRSQPGLIRSLSRYQESLRAVPQILTEVVPLTLEVLERGATVRERYGLLTNDSLIVAMMELRGITALATADEDFRRVPSLRVYLPSDL